MKGIDISRYDGYPLEPIPKKAFDESDFIIVKATQGTVYKYTDIFKKQMEMVLKSGKLAGAYHYAAGGDPKQEADYFIETVKPYLGRIIVCLDWEKNQNKAWGNKSWCKSFIERVQEKTGLTCFLYTGLDGCKQNELLSTKVPLWFAGYPSDNNSWDVPKFKYDLGKWKAYTIWQYTSSGEKIDRNVTPLSLKQWKAYAKIKEGYRGKFPTLPPRGYYKTGDGITKYLQYSKNIERVQRVVNWYLNANLIEDGKYGDKTTEAVRGLQKAIKVPVNGCFGNLCLEAMKKAKK